MEEEEEELCAVWFHFHSHTVFVFRLLPGLQIGRSSQFDVHDWSTDDTKHFCRSLNVLRERHENYIKTSFLYLHFDFSSRNQVHHFTFFPTSDIFDAFLFKFSGKKKTGDCFFLGTFLCAGLDQRKIFFLVQDEMESKHFCCTELFASYNHILFHLIWGEVGA